MTHAWDAEQTVEPAEALILISSQFPQLAPQTIELLGVGWDNTAYLVNGIWVFRFPRRHLAVSLLQSEYALLPQIAPYVSIPIPHPQWLGAPSTIYPWPFMGYQHLEGTPACHLALSEQERLHLAEPLAQFLSALHAIPISSQLALHLPGDVLGRLHVQKLTDRIEKNLNELAQLAIFRKKESFAEFLKEAQRLIPSDPPCVVHGDFYVRHFLVNDKRFLTGVIDWGDTHLGQRALDLSIAHSFLPTSAHSLFRRAYGAVTEMTWQLARLRAIHYGAVLALYGYHSSDVHLVREGIGTLDRLASS